MFHHDSRDTTAIMNCINLVFEDKRLTAVLVMTWLVVVLVTFWSLGVMQTQFVSFGPSPETFFMGICLHTWPRWAMVAVFTFISTAVNDFVGDALVPFITNAIQDHKTIFLPYSKFTCWAITQALSVYGCTMSIFSIYLLLSQLDFMLIRLAADSIVNMYTTYRFMKDKKVNAERYYRSQRPLSSGAADDDILHDIDNPHDDDAPPAQPPAGRSRTKAQSDQLRPHQRKSFPSFKPKRHVKSSHQHPLRPRVHIQDSHGAEYSGPILDQGMQRASHMASPYHSIPSGSAPATGAAAGEDRQRLLQNATIPCAPSVDDMNRLRTARLNETGLDMFVPTAAVLSQQEDGTCLYSAEPAEQEATTMLRNHIIEIEEDDVTRPK